jgi:hypothetical protein
MIKEALQYLIALGNAEQRKVGNQDFSTQPLHLIKQPTPAAIVVRSLSGMVEYLKSEFDELVDDERTLMVHVESPTDVVVFSTFNNDMVRNTLIQAKALLPEYRYGNWYDAEEFNIKLQSVFVPNNDRATMLKVVGNIKEENVNSFGDDGVSQKVTAKTGVATIAEVPVPNPVLLKPFRTFVEVPQPESEFVFRMRTGPSCALFEADGGAWKVEAMDNVRDYLTEKLKDQIDASKIIIIA